MSDFKLETQLITDAIKTANDENTQLEICGGGSKRFFGNDLSALPRLDVTANQGIVQYEPGELVLQVRSGTPLAEVTAALDEQGQMLAFEPPHYDGDATIGGVVAAGLSGSRRPYTGSVRDYVLGVDIIDGIGNQMSFGGQVMKNVAGYDVSRLMVGSLGCLGVITEVSFKVLPKPALEQIQKLSMDVGTAQQTMLGFLRQPLVSASAYCQGSLYVRVSGAELSVQQLSKQLGGETVDNDFFSDLDNLVLLDKLPSSEGKKPSIKRLSIKASASDGLDQAVLIDWGGGQRWFTQGYEHPEVTLFRAGDVSESSTNQAQRFAPLAPVILKMHQGLKAKFDPNNVLNPQKMYSEV